MRHLYECPMRWADLDLLGHVNNVVYVDYLQEARVDLLRAAVRPVRLGELAEGVVVVRHEVSYVAPLTFSFRAVKIECWVTEIRTGSFTLAYEVFQDDPEAAEGRRVHLRATTVLAPYVFGGEHPRRLTAEEKEALAPYLEAPLERTPAIGPVPHGEAGHYPVQVRFSDVDVYGHVNNVKYFEYLQEARIWLMEKLRRAAPHPLPDLSIVVAQTDVDYRLPILFRREPYDVWSAVTRVGNRSMTIESEICDATTVLARARVVIVFFDLKTQRSTAPPEGYRELLAGLAAAEPRPGG
ncbi:acyl-CoA thioesterase [Nocardioides pantholopis]|uniref:acyl-CoA thioesterase n=1 Tax=Nocardioides pantholopis TaxID=2483798 RepID=UPI000F080CBD|nr:thioesterase family protein [Nocardioides pantholopis]